MMADKHTERQLHVFHRLSPYSMAWVLMRSLSAHKTKEWRIFQDRASGKQAQKGLAAHAVRTWLQYDMAYCLMRKVVDLLAPFATPDDPDLSMIVKSELDENRLELEGIRGE